MQLQLKNLPYLFIEIWENQVQGPYEFQKLWKVMDIENAIFQVWKGEDFQNGFGKLLDFCLEKYPNMDVFAHFTIFVLQNLIYQEIKKYVVEESGFLFLWGFKMQMKIRFMVFGNFVIFCFVKVLEVFLKELVRTLQAFL